MYLWGSHKPESRETDEESLFTTWTFHRLFHPVFVVLVGSLQVLEPVGSGILFYILHQGHVSDDKTWPATSGNSGQCYPHIVLLLFVIRRVRYRRVADLAGYRPLRAIGQRIRDCGDLCGWRT